MGERGADRDARPRLNRLVTIVRTAADALTAVLIAPVCAACEAPLHEPTRGAVCGQCWGAIPLIPSPVCAVCGQPLPSWRATSVTSGTCARCRRADPRLRVMRSAALFDGSLPQIIYAFKYGERRSLAKPLAALIRSNAGDVLACADAAVPVPLHMRRLRQRGFNQAADLTRHLGLPVLPCLQRVRDTPSQTDLPAARRHSNVRGAFALRSRWTAQSRLSGLRLLLVDDVATTGATLEACAVTLARAGAGEVMAVTVARAAARRV